MTGTLVACCRETVSESVEQPAPELFPGEIDGVPVFWSDVGGPVSAGLLFRVGWSDEALSGRGLTHLVEHLALTHLGVDTPYVRNGFTEPATTRFVMSGTPEQAVEFLHGVCRALTDL